MDVTSVLPPDAIPSVDEPAFGTAYAGDADDEVVVLAGDPAKAYPVRALHGHEVVNDSVAGDPVAVTWCPICWSAAVYDRRVGDRTLTFGVSGKLADDALVMYDRETESEWRQTTGEAIAGPLAGEALAMRPAAKTTWAGFREQYPEGVVLQPPRGDLAAYDAGGYEAYRDGEGFGLGPMRGTGPSRTWDRADLDPKALVLGVEVGEAARGYPRPRVEAAGGVVRDTLGGRAIVVTCVEGHLDAFLDPEVALRVEDDRLVGDGTIWDPTTGASADGRTLERVPARRLFAFAWRDAHGAGAFWA